MVKVRFDDFFEKKFRKLKDNSIKSQIKKKIKKIIKNPEIGKPMRCARKATREVYIGSFRLSYAYSKEEDKLTFLDFYHKDE